MASSLYLHAKRAEDSRRLRRCLSSFYGNSARKNSGMRNTSRSNSDSLCPFFLKKARVYSLALGTHAHAVVCRRRSHRCIEHLSLCSSGISAKRFYPFSLIFFLTVHIESRRRKFAKKQFDIIQNFIFRLSGSVCYLFRENGEMRQTCSNLVVEEPF